MNVVDSSGWLEYFAGTLRAKLFSKPIENTRQLIVPTISIFEVFKKIKTERGEEPALQAVVQMKLGKVVPLDVNLALESAKISSEKRMPMADSIILATAKKFNAILFTQDKNFEGIEGVHYHEKK